MLYNQISSNKRRTVVLLIVFFMLLAAIGAAVGYLWLGDMTFGVVIAVIIGAIYAMSMIFQSTNVVMSMNHAREVTEQEAPQLYHIVEDMAMVAQIPMPRVFIIEDQSLNAFATGSSPENAAVAATTGLLAVMNREELEGVIGHEVSHIRNYDIRISTIAVALASAITLLSSLGSRMVWFGGGRRRSDDRDNGTGLLVFLFSILSLILAPLAATLLQLAISRKREYLADASSVELTRNPQGMINALQKLQQSAPMQQPVDAASAALYINDPIKKEERLTSLFSTHPSISDRIERLRQM
ncbi:zinc metalloprotease HtpX [Streptococcus alactolyticus]|jgi:heat shock protein HtpX|uniref:Protease HtpX homolog n=1 Tax=Streptococcus alactolyticus TaxID=29389 RepID=A0A6N7WQY9_STRAY|nr:MULTISPECIES: zinc metalloprotease HtpX [Streptococcus]MDE2587205.1 zinc metalloprotease HtpX [Lactobacillales bacterium]MCF2666024.1 zinc metalloprotease HtpX [Streptococcus alactolyticus]MCF2678148.1 zinc metalloprotease HtpX [Streptococcus alactolyticus]MCI6904290.1 zinc metalloprotease HtpX [Streptococcus alactolyticus]MDD7361461.1 zinc metalloprotease HtpX [Streptococcus alactolyticus]